MGRLTDRVTGLFGASGLNPNGVVRDITDAASFSTSEFDTGVNWIDGRPVFGLISLVTGGNLLSTKVVPEFENTTPITITCLAPIAGTWLPLTEIIYSPSMSPQLAINHATLDLTGATLRVFARYVKDAS